MDNKISLISKAIQKKFSLFGINKSREITRLVFEISKRDSIDFISVINSIQETKYEKVKNFLLEKRYPKSYALSRKNNFYLPDLDIDDNNKANLNLSKFNPKNIYYTDMV